MLNNERIVPNKDDINFIRHLERYKFAKNFVKDKTVFSIACGVGYGEHLLANKGKAQKVIDNDSSLLLFSLMLSKDNLKNKYISKK